MPKRRPAQTRKSHKLNKQQLSNRAQKAWTTKYKRYHYASEDPLQKKIDDARGARRVGRHIIGGEQLQFDFIQKEKEAEAHKAMESLAEWKERKRKEEEEALAKSKAAQEESLKKSRAETRRREQARTEQGLYPEEGITTAQGSTGGRRKRGRGPDEEPTDADTRDERIFGTRGSGHDIDIGQLIAEKRESENMDFSDIIHDPDIRSRLRGADSEAYRTFEAKLLARQEAERRSKRDELEARHGRQEGYAGAYQRTPKEQEVVGAVDTHMRYKIKKGESPDAFRHRVAVDLTRVLPPRVADQVADNITKFKLRWEGTDQEAAGRAAIGRLASRVGGEVQRRESRKSEQAAATRFAEELYDMELRERQGELKHSVIGGIGQRFLSDNNRLKFDDIDQRLKNGEIDADTAKGLKEFKINERTQLIRNQLERAVNDPIDFYGDVLQKSPRSVSSNISQQGGSQMRDYTGLHIEHMGRAASKYPHPISKDEINKLADDIAKSSARSGSKEHDKLLDRIDSLRFRASTSWDPMLVHDNPILKRGPRAAEGFAMHVEPQRSVQSAEEFYRAVGHEKVRGLQGIKEQGKFVKEQNKRTLLGLKSGDYYIGYDRSGKPVDPGGSDYGMTANKHWEYKTASGRKKYVPFGDTRTKIDQIVDPVTGVRRDPEHKLARKFEDTVNIKLGGRKPRLDYDQPWQEGVPLHKDIVVPLHSMKSGVQTKTFVRNKQVRDENDIIQTESERTRVRYMPWAYTRNERGDADQVAIRIPGKGQIGERVIYANFNSESEGMSNLSKYALAPARARQERQMRERASSIRGQRRIPDSDNTAQTLRVRQDWTELNAPVFDRNLQAFRAPNEEEKKMGLAKDIAAAGVATAGLKSRKRLLQAAGKGVNRGSARLAKRSPGYRKTLDSWSMKDYKLVDLKTGVVDPMGANVANWHYMAKHPLSSPEGLAHGVRVDTGYYRQSRFIHPHRVLARELKRERLHLQKLERTEAFFEHANRMDAPGYKKRFARFLDPRKRDIEYSDWTRPRLKEAKLQAAWNKASEGKVIEPGGSGRARRAAQAANREAGRLQSFSDKRIRDLKPEWVHVGGVPDHMALVPYDPKIGGSPKGHPATLYGRSSVNSNYLIAGGIVLAVAGGAYAYHRHRQRHEMEEGQVPQTFINRYTPGPLKIKTPYVRTVERQRIGSHAITDELRLTGRKIPTRGAVGVHNKVLWKGSPVDRGYDADLPVLGGLSLRTPRAGRTTGKIFLDPNRMERKRIRDRGTGVYVGSRRIARFKIDKKSPVKLKTKNPNALSAKDREDLVYAFGLDEHQRRMAPENFRAQEEARRVMDFYSSGRTDTSLLRQMEDPDAVRKIRRKKVDSRLGSSGELESYRDTQGNIGWRVKGQSKRRDSKRRRLQERFSSGWTGQGGRGKLFGE